MPIAVVSGNQFVECELKVMLKMLGVLSFLVQMELMHSWLGMSLSNRTDFLSSKEADIFMGKGNTMDLHIKQF